MKLLKLGMLNLQSDRWIDGLSVFDDIVVVKAYPKEKQVSGLLYHEMDINNGVRGLLLKCILYYNSRKWATCIEFLLIFMFRIVIREDIKWLKELDYDEVHASYNDFDESALLLVLFKPYLRKNVRITRAYKESRPEYKFLEKKAFEYSDRVVLNTSYNVDFFKNKYGNSIFRNKIIVVDADEDAIGEKYIEGLSYSKKLSSIDGKKHVVILAGRVFSDTRDTRSGSRLCYISMINDLISAGLIVHLHTLWIEPDINGVNQYEVLSNKNKNLFYIEHPLNFDEAHWKDSYSILSRYDYGVLHNFIEGNSTSEFDKYNIPHRYYEYELAHVAPILLKDKTIVMQDLILSNKSGIIYENPNEIVRASEVHFSTSSFKDYINKLYS